MAGPVRDPYEVLGVPASVSDAELRTAYRKLVQRHHPDHNNGSPAAAQRFEAVQDAYAQILERRRAAPHQTGNDPGLEARIADLERELREAREASEQARRATHEAVREAAQEAAREAAEAEVRRSAAQRPPRPTPEELGYVTTEDSFSKILDDAQAELSNRLSQARNSSLAKRLGDLLRGEGDD